MNTLATDDASLNENSNKYEKIKQQNRERQKRYYERKREIILQKKQGQRDKVKEILKRENPPPIQTPPTEPIFQTNHIEASLQKSQ